MDSEKKKELVNGLIYHFRMLWDHANSMEKLIQDVNNKNHDVDALIRELRLDQIGKSLDSIDAFSESCREKLTTLAKDK